MFIRSERLFLRPAWAEDMADVVAAIGNETVVQSLDRAPWPYRPDPACMAASHPHFLVTLPGADGARLIGCAGFAACEGETEIGMFTAPQYAGQGYASEALRSLLALARTLGHRRVIARPFHDEAAWRRVLEKVCFRPTGRLSERLHRARGVAEPVRVHALDLAAPGNCDGPDCTFADQRGLMRAA